MKRLIHASSIVALTCCAISAPIHAGDYRLVPITDEQQGAFLQVIALNDKAEVVGARQLGDDVSAFRWRRGEVSEVHVAPSDARGINDRGDIVGVTLLQPLASYLRQDDQIIDLEVDPNSDTVVAGINNRRQVIGYSGSDVFLWRRGQVTLLDALPGDSQAVPVAINNRGVATGYSIDASGSNSRAVLWQRGTVMALGGMEDADRQQPFDINDRGQVLVGARFPTRFVTVLWDGGEVSELPLVYPGQSFYTAWSLNNAGDIVGATFNTDTGVSVATLWRNGVALDLNTLICDDDPLKPFVTLITGSLINNKGEIVAEGFDSRVPGALFPYLLKR